MTDNALVLRTGTLKVISEFTKAKYDEARAALAQTMKRGDRLTARSPIDDTKVGSITMTDPPSECRVVDEGALRTWMFQHYPELCESGYEVIGSDKEVIDVLFEHAPYLLRRIQRVTSDAVRELRAAAVTLGTVMGPGGEADVPGLELHTPDAVVRCLPAGTGLQAVMDLYSKGRLGLDGTLKELEA